MAEYTYKDVIIDPEDPRVEVGKEYYFGNNPSCLLRNISQLSADEGRLVMKDSAIEPQSSPFMSSENEWFVCLIRKKEPEKKYVPFDLSDPEVRKSLLGSLIKSKGGKEEQIIYWLWVCDGEWMINADISPAELLEKWVFYRGVPCGQLVEAEK